MEAPQHPEPAARSDVHATESLPAGDTVGVAGEERGEAHERLTSSERQRIRQHFTRRLCSCGHALIYWLPSKRTIAARAVGVGKAWKLPAGAELIGEYAHPFPGNEFLGDLDALIERLRVQAKRGGELAAA